MKKSLPKVLITGANGQMGQTLFHHARAENFNIYACTRDKLDITNITSIHRAIANIAPDIIINTAAYTGVDKAENEIKKARQVNYLGTKNLSIACHKNRIPLIHLATDYIFDGTNHKPYIENDKENPLNVYGESKWLGEVAIREHIEKHIILRVSGVYSEYGHNFLKSILHLASSYETLHIVNDQFTCPTYAGNIAHVIYTLIEKQRHWGTYHYSDGTIVSWYQFACKIVEDAKKIHSLRVQHINSISTKEYQAAAKRPAFSVLSCDKIKSDFGIEQMNSIDNLRAIIQGIKI